MTKKAMRAGTVTTPDQPDRNRLEKEWTLSAVRYIDLNSDPRAMIKPAQSQPYGPFAKAALTTL